METARSVIGIIVVSVHGLKKIILKFFTMLYHTPVVLSIFWLSQIIVGNARIGGPCYIYFDLSQNLHPFGQKSTGSHRSLLNKPSQITWSSFFCTSQMCLSKPTKKKKCILRHCLLATKSCIPLRWRDPQPPSVTLWLMKVEELNNMEDLVPLCL